MPELTIPNVRLSSEGEYEVDVPDLDVYRERVHTQPEGFTKKMIRSMTDAFPDKFNGPEEAFCVCDVFKYLIANGLSNGEKVTIEGLGTLSRDEQSQKIVFSPE